MTTVNNSYLLSLYGGSSSSGANLFATVAGGAAQSNDTSALITAAANAKAKPPTAPWRRAEAADDALVRQALMGKRFVDDNAAQLDVRGASDDYRKLFAVYQGLNTLEALATRYSAKGVGEFERQQIARAFDKGLKEVQGYADAAKLDNIRLTKGSAMTRDQSLVGMKRTDTVYETGIIHSGNAGDPVAAFQGPVKFDVTLKKLGVNTTVTMDLSDMGSTPRTMANVLSYMNGKLEAGGFRTRFATERVSGAAKPITVGGKTVTLPDKADSWKLNVKGDIGETLTFSAPDTAEAVYVAQMAGKPEIETKTSTGTKVTPATLNGQLLKFQTDVSAGSAPPDPIAMPDDQNWVDGRVFSTKLGTGQGTVHASVAGPDGSIYVIADAVDAVATQTIKGDQDVALSKYDSAGNLVWSRTLGAAETASGYALSVAADGKVAIAGSVTGVLDPGSSGLDAKKADSFVTLFDASGQEMWTQRRAARLEDEATAVAFGADGTVYVAGRARSAMPGSDGGIGGWDSYLQAFATVAGPVAYSAGSTSASLTKTPTWKGQSVFTVQYGTTGQDKPAGIVVDGNSVYLAGAEDGDAVVRKFDLVSGSDPTLAATRNLGAVQGSLAGLALDGGSLVLAGTTTNGSLLGGVPTYAYSGQGSDAFAARISLDLQPDGVNDRIAYYGGAGADTATAVAVSNGKVWITGSTTGDLPGTTVQGSGTAPKDGYLARLDLDTGAADWTRRFTSTDQQVAPTSIAVDATGASVLDRLGLPKGTLQFKDSQLVTSGTSVRAGDQFFIRAQEGGAKVAVKITATDTLQTLAAKVRRAAGFAAKVEVQKKGDYDTLKITPLNDRASVEVLAGPTGKNALEALGLTEGVVSNATLVSDNKDVERVYGLGLAQELKLADTDTAATALKFVQMAISTVKNAYNFISNPDLFAKGDGSGSTNKSASGPVPTYLTNQLANYQAALSRLGG